MSLQANQPAEADPYSPPLWNISVQTSGPVRGLEPGAAVEGTLSGGQKQIYQIALAEGQCASITVEQRGIDLSVQLAGPDEKVFTQIEFASEKSNTGKAELFAQPPGNYRIVIAAKQPSASEGRYLVRLDELGACTDKQLAFQEIRRLAGEFNRLFRSGKYAEAIAAGEHGLEIRERVLGPEHKETAASIYNIAEVYRQMGNYPKAEALAQRALQIREKVLGPDHPDVALSLTSLGAIYRQAGNYSKAEPLLQRALQIREKVLGQEHLDVATSLNSLAVLYGQMGHYGQAEPLFLRALHIREKVRGPDSPDVAGSLNNLANLYQLTGDLVKAEQVYERAVAIKEKTLGPEHRDVALSLNNLGIVLRNRGDFVKAEQLYNRALAIREKALGPEHIDVAASLHNLAIVTRDQGDYPRTEALHKRALEIQTKAFGPDHPDVAASLSNLAGLYRLTGESEKVEPLFQRALAIQEKALGPDHPEVAMSLNGLARHYIEQGDYSKAEPLLNRALLIGEKSLGPEHPEVASSFSRISDVNAAKGQIENAVAAQSRADAITEHNIALNLTTGSERQKLAYLNSLSDTTDRTVSLHVRSAPDNSEARSLAATAILQRKGRVLDAMADSLTALRQRFSAEDQKLLDRLKETTAQLAGLVLNGPQQMTLAEHQQRINALEEQRERLESQISNRSAGFYPQTKPVTLAAVRTAVPDGAALVEFAVYQPHNTRVEKDQKSSGEPRYVAYVLLRQGEVKWKELGDARIIDEAVGQMREALRDPARRDVVQLSRELHRRVMQPLRAMVSPATRLIISPEGPLNLIPFEALVDEQQRYLVESYSISYVTGGRDLLRMQVARDSKSRPVVVADPLFGEPPIAQAEPARASKSQNSLRRRGQSITTAEDLSSVYFAPLVGTEQESRAIKLLFPDAEVLTRQQATESALKRIDAPRILHVATHGFFLQSADNANPQLKSGRETAGTRAINAHAKIENPLLRSGLALAGANYRASSGEDGILTALEASSLNLWGTKLVTLSACDTGLGAVKGGEGVYGLRRAFVLAGAESLVMSLWPVSDTVTRELMTAYYAGLKNGLGRGEALRQVQLNMLKRKGRQHPFYWASFIQSGEWANLEGKR